MENLEAGPDIVEKAKIPECLGEGDCEILKVHDDGDLTVSCRGSKYVVTTEGEVFKQFPLRPKNWDEIKTELTDGAPITWEGNMDEFLENAAEAIVKGMDG
jgi:hypothetical protein